MSAPMPGQIHEIYRERIIRARTMTLAQRLLEGPRLFDLAAKFTKAGIRMQNPGADEAQVDEIFRERLRLQRRLECPP